MTSQDMVPDRRMSNSGQIPLDEWHDLGYKTGMRSETTVAGRWGEPLADYLNTLRAANRSRQTVYLRSYQLRVLSQGFPERDPWTITGTELVEFVASHDTWAAGSKRAARTAYRGFYAWGVRKGYVRVSPAEDLAPVHAPVGRPRPAAPDAIQRALVEAPERVRLMIYLGAQLGLRRGEIARVHASHVGRDAEGFTLRVLGKGSKERIVPLTDRLAALIVRAGERDGWCFPSYHRGDDRFPTGSHLSAARVGELISEHLPEGVTTHMLRHRFASNLYMATDRDLRAVQEALGHTSVATTQIYTEVPQSVMRRGMAEL